jgi:internalin A
MTMSDAETAYKAAEAAIERVRANGEAMLDLSGDVYYNALTSLPDSIAQLTALTTLSLSGTQVSDLTPIAPLTALTTLSLFGTQVSDLTPIAPLTSLTTLNLGGTQVSDLTSIAPLTALTLLNLSGTQVSDLTSIAPLTSLTMLNLNSTQVSDLTPIAPLTALKLLNLSGTQVSDLTPIAPLTALTTLSLSGTQVSDLTPIAPLTALTLLNLSGTQVSDLTPIAQLTSLTTLNLGGTQVSDLTPIAQLTSLTMLNLNSTQVSDPRPLTALRKLAESPEINGLSFEKIAAARLDPRIAEIAKIKGRKIRAVELFAYLEGWEQPVEFNESGPAPSTLFDVQTIDDRLEIADSHPSEAERDDQLKQVLHNRLKVRNTDLERLAGNRFFVLCAKARSLTTRLDGNFDDLDMLNIHLDVEELTRLKDRGAERDGDEPFPQEVADALADVVSIGPGLTLDNGAVELLEKRKRRFAANPFTADQQAAHDDFSTAVAQDPAAFGDRLRALETQVLEREDDSAGAAVQDAATRNILIKFGRLALAVGAPVATNVLATILAPPIKAFLIAEWPVIAEVAALYGPSFQGWFLSAMSGFTESAGLVANTQPRAVERPVKPEEDEV